MKSSFLVIMRFLLLAIGCISSTVLMAQRPVIRSVEASTASAGQTISINGNNFGTDASKISVFFGAVQGTVIPPVSDQLIEVEVPAGATYRSITVTRAQGSGPGLTGYSNEEFLLDFHGTHPFDVSNLSAQEDFSAENGLYDLCLCDFNGDQKADIATANKASNNISVLLSNSTPGTVAFPPKSPATLTPVLISIGAKSLHLGCGDLNGDGKSDIVATSGDDGNRIFVLQNMGAGVFTPQTITLNTLGTQKVKIADLDLDGKPELIVTHKKGPPAMISILKNKTTGSTIAFDAPLDINVSLATTTDGLDVADFNGDDLPEIIVGQSLGKDLFILKNTSVSGAISFGDVLHLATSGDGVVNIRIGDLDNDGKPDIAATQVTKNLVAIFLNTSTNANMSFGTPVPISTEATPWGVDFGDLDGDGNIDMAIASITKTNLTILNNESSPGSLNFTKSLVPTTLITRHISIGDVDGDGKPDISFTSIDDLNPKVSVMRNQACMIPEISPEEPINVCNGQNVVLNSTASGGATYVWKDETNNATVGTNSSILTLLSPAVSVTNYSVTVSPQAGGISCPASTAEVTVTVGNGTATAPTFISPPTSPVCTGSPFSLTVNATSGKTYQWTGPDNFTFSGNPMSIADFELKNAGKYTVKSIDTGSGCESQEASITVEAVEAQNFTLTYSGAEILCEGDVKVLQLTPSSSTFTIQWFKNSSSFSGHDKDTLKVNSSGDYYAQVNIPNCGPPKNSTTASIVVALKPTIDFTSDPATSACSGQNIQFTNLSTNPNTTLSPTYQWTFTENPGSSTSSDTNPVHKFNSGTTYTSTITLAASFNGIDCGTPKSKTLTVSPAPSVEIKSVAHPDFQFCKGDSIKLELTNTFLSYKWSTNQTTPFIYVKQDGSYSVEVKTSSCTLNADQIVSSTEPIVAVSADPEEIAEGQSSQLSASGLQSYSWSPDSTLSSSTISNPVASPKVTTTYTVAGQDENGCRGKKTIQVSVIGEAIVNKLKPYNFFSPNGSGPNEQWTVEKILDYPQCNVSIYDQKGIKVFEAKPYNNDWDGTFHGKKLPEGVYYYIIRCDGEEGKTRSGSITLLR